MKKLIIVFVVYLISMQTLECFAQLTQSDVNLKIKDGKYKIEYNGKEFDANESVLTIKPKSQAFRNLQLEILSENQLGFVDIKIPENRTIEEFANELRKTGLFDVVEYNAFGEYLSYTPDDSWLQQQWNLTALNMFNAWDFTTGDPSIVVAVLDSGTDWEHDDLGMGNDGYQNIFLNQREDAWPLENEPLSANGIDDDNNGKLDDWKGWNYALENNDSRPQYNDHGTSVAGIISAKTNNDFGIAGFAGGNYGQGVKVLPICVGYETPNMSKVDDAIIYAVNCGARVIQLSIMGPQATNLDAAIDFAFLNNTVVVCASGNYNSNTVSYPASNHEVIAVGATIMDSTRRFDSNYGTELDIVAPGEEIPSTTFDNSFKNFKGTSHAAPQVSAIVALILSLNNNLDVSDVTDIIESTAHKIEAYTFTTIPGRAYTWNNEVGYGLIDAYAALQAAACYSRIENTTYSTNVSLRGCSSIEMKNVKVKAGAKLTIDPISSVFINGAFEVESGSGFEIQ